MDPVVGVTSEQDGVDRPATPNPQYQPLQNYGIIGDLHTVALVGMDGSIDYMCFPRFDSPTLFAALLDSERGGRFALTPLLSAPRHKQLYLPDTAVLLTRFLAEEGVAEISDFMPMQDKGHRHDLVRRVKTVRGEIKYRLLFQPRFNYARTSHRVERKDDCEFWFLPDDHALAGVRLRSHTPLQIRDGDAYAEFTLRAGESAVFVLEECCPAHESPSQQADYSVESFKETVNAWRRWIGRSNYKGRWREMVNRSALTLKLLISQPHGSMVAAPTFGLPEQLGGVRNWDYRYTWIRDASFSVYALIRLGYTEEAAAFINWFEARCDDLNPSGSPLQIMYRLDGSKNLSEEILTHFSGYMDSRPVRIGNGAAHQLQLDIYGELMDSIYLYDKYGAPISYDLWRNLRRLMEWLCHNWRQPDDGIWEVRGGQRNFTYSRVLCWVALDRAIRLATKRSFPGPLEEWARTRDQIYETIMTDFWDPEWRAFVQFKGGRSLDSSCLLMPLVRFVSPVDPRWLSTLAALEEHLVSDSLVYRYLNSLNPEYSDGLEGNEGTFCMCSFWYVECLSRSGDLQKARYFFEKMLGYANHLGLYAEELGPRGEHLGNFPQAFTHVGLISAAYDLDRRLSASGAEV